MNTFDFQAVHSLCIYDDNLNKGYHNVDEIYDFIQNNKLMLNSLSRR